MIKRNIIELKNVTKKYGISGLTNTVLDNFCLSIQQSDFVSIYGPSGSGKTTLLSILGLMDKSFSGSYKLNGLDISELSENEVSQYRNKEIGYVFQSFDLISELNVFENIAMPVRHSNKNWNLKQRVINALEMVKMRHSHSYYPDKLAIVQQRLLSIARAMVMSPSILLVDEPTNNLDSSNSELLMSVLKEINDTGVTLFFATHDTYHANKATTRINLFDGKIYTPNEFKRL